MMHVIAASQRCRFPHYITICSFPIVSHSRMCFTNSNTGPSGTVKLAKKEAAAKPAAASTKEKKPAAKVHLLA